MTDPVPPRSAASAAHDAVLRSRRLSDLDPVTLYQLIRLREEVFTLEQKVDEGDLDGRELEEQTVLVWFERPADGGAGVPEPIAHARVLVDPEGTARIGRVVVRADARRGGLGRAVMEAALSVAGELAPGAEVRIDAQAYLQDWYASMGFRTVGDHFLEGGIDHVLMIRAADAPCR